MTGIPQRPGGRSARVRRAVLAATLDILIEDGLEAVAIPAIAERSGVHHTSIYRRWKDRTALIREAVLNAVDAAAPIPDTGSLRSDLTVMLDDVRELLNSPLGAVLLAVSRIRDGDLAELRRTYWGARLDHCSTIIEHAVARGEISAATDHRLVFELLIGPMHARALLSADTFDDVETTTIVAAVLYGIAHAGTSNHNAQNHGRTTRQPSQRTR